MKLNNKGWGLSTLLICFCIILIFLVISVYYAYRFSEKIDKDIEPDNSDNIVIDYYKNLENNINSAILNYINNGQIIVNNGSTMMLGLTDLRELGFTENIIDKVTRNECSGYVIIKNINNVMDINSYLKCDNYITEGYNG